jgi:hypothetical protein
LLVDGVGLRDKLVRWQQCACTTNHSPSVLNISRVTDTINIHPTQQIF